jgi:hypothetical protein
VSADGRAAPMHHALRPARPVSEDWRVEVAMRWSPRGLLLEYLFGVSAGRLRLPPRSAKPAARDLLWQRTCGELFLGVRGEPAYLEFNFSPSGDWAAYAFESPRAGGRTHEWRGPAPDVRVLPGDDASRLVVTLPQSALQALARAVPAAGGAAPWDVGLAAVVETRPGLISHWALIHPRREPDFHDREGFVAQLCVPEEGAG